MTTAEKKTGIPTIEEIESQCSPSGKILVKSARWFAQRHRHDQPEVSDMVYAIFWNTTTRAELETADIDYERARKTFEEIIKSGLNKNKPAGSIQDIFIVADKNRMESGSPQIRAGDWLMAIYSSPTEGGEAFREALISVSGERSVGLVSALKASIRLEESLRET
ncbi:MAG: hypothetical protein Q7R31_00545 [Candidatus Levybacteria bacterium]|nr:hypothetical protein [Candidatus Levybacteria bacterium]